MQNIPKTFVVNLERSPDRRLHMETHLADLEIPFEFFTGTDGERLTKQERKLYSNTMAVKVFGRKLHHNEIGCSLSHYYLYKLIVKQRLSEALILEDDVILHPDFGGILRNRSAFPEDWQFINFGNRHAPEDPIPSNPIAERYSASRFKGWQTMTNCYLVRLSAAEWLLENALPVRMGPDDLLAYANENGVRSYGVIPKVVDQLQVQSSIWKGEDWQEFNKKARSSLSGRLLSTYYRMKRIPDRLKQMLKS